MARYLVVLLTLISGFAFSGPATEFQQQPKTDSLLAVLTTLAEDTSKVRTLQKLAWNKLFNQPDTANILLNQALKLASDLNFKAGIAKSYNHMGIYHAVQGRNDSAIYYTSECLKINEELHDSTAMADAYSNLGVIYKRMGDYKKSMEYHLNSLRIRNALNSQAGQMSTYNNLGVLSDLLGNYEKSLDYYEQSLQIARNLNHEMDIATALSNIGILHFNQGRYDLALENYEEYLEISMRIGRKSDIAIGYLNIGGVYHELGEYEKALEYYTKSLEINEEMGRRSYMANCHRNIGTIYISTGNYQIAINHLHQALTISREAGAKEIIKESFKWLAVAYSKINQYEQAYTFHQKYTTMKDSLLNEEKARQINELEMKYESEEKQNEIVLLSKEKDLQNAQIVSQSRIRNILIGSFFLLFIFIALLIRGYRKRLQTNQALAEKNEEIKNQRIRDLEKNQKINSMQAMVEGQEAERLRIARDLHDSLGGLLSSVKMHFAELNRNDNESFSKVDSLIDDSCNELRRVAHNMMPDALIKFGLVNALEDLAGKLETDGKLSINIQAIGMNYRYERSAEITIYRIIQELLNNVIKHADASEVLIQLAQHGNQLNIIVEDDGSGIKQGRGKENGMGLKNVESRVSYLNGRIEYDSSDKSGTTVTIDVPVLTERLS